jgi:hypothetical protein
MLSGKPIPGQAQKLDALAKTTTLVDHKDGLTKNVMTVFRIEGIRDSVVASYSTQINSEEYSH